MTKKRSKGLLLAGLVIALTIVAAICTLGDQKPPELLTTNEPCIFVHNHCIAYPDLARGIVSSL